MKLTAILCTLRKDPRFDIMADSLSRSYLKLLHDYPEAKFELIVVDGQLWYMKDRRQQLDDAVKGRFTYRQVEPKPSNWQGPTRITSRDWYDLCGARNTGICYASKDSHIILFDDCSVLDEKFLTRHYKAGLAGACIAGSFRSYTRAVIKQGVILEGDLHPAGIDARVEHGFRIAPGGWMYGLNISFPLKSALAVNGYDEYYSGQGGSEDCHQFDTEIITQHGIKKIGELVGQTVSVLTSNRKWVDAPIKQFSDQQLWKLVVQNGYKHTKELFCTGNHKWYVKNYADKSERNVHLVTTSELQVNKHRLCYLTANNALKTNTVPSPFGIAHGITFGDGCTEKEKTANKIALYGKKKELSLYFSGCTSYKTKCDGIVFGGLPNHFREVPDLTENTSYLLGWVMGYFAADGCVSKSGGVTFASASLENIKFFRDVCLILGIECYPIRTEKRDTNYKDNSTLHKVSLGIHTLTPDFFLRQQHKERFHENEKTEYTTTKLNEWKVILVEPTDRIEPTYCAVVPDTHAFVLEGNILTHNCDFGVRLERNKNKIIFVPDCLIYQILETHEPVCEFETWGKPQKTPQKEALLRDGKMHFANELLIQDLFDDPTRIWTRGNDFTLDNLWNHVQVGGSFPRVRSVSVDWRDGKSLTEM